MTPVQQHALDYFVSMGWTPAQAAGIVANLIAESGLRPDAVGDGGAAYGIAQWHPDRQANFHAVIGKDIHDSTLDDQLAFVHAELVGSEKAAGDTLRVCSTAYGAGSCVSRRYERPADQEAEAHKRGVLAEQLAAQDNAGAAITPSPAPPYVGPAASAPNAPKQPEKSMPLLALLPILAQIIPQLAGLFGGAKDQRNMATIGKVLDVVVGATGQTGPATVGTVGAAIDAMHADPALVQKVTAAIVTHPDVMPFLTITEVGGGAGAAADRDSKARAVEVPFWKNSAVFWVSVMLLPMVVWYVGASIVGGVEIPDHWPWFPVLVLKLFGTAWDSGAKVGLANLVVGLVLGGICGVYYGISVTQAKQQQPQQPPSTT